MVTEISGPLSTVIRLKEGQTVRRHIDHVKLRDSTSDQKESGHASPEQDEGAMDLPNQDVKDHDATADESLAPVVDIPELPAEVNVEPVQNNPGPGLPTVPLRRSTRNRHPPDRL